MDTERDKYSMINFEETELRLGLPGGSLNDGESSLRSSGTGKRGFSETTATVDLKLNLSSSGDSVSASSVAFDKAKEKSSSSNSTTATTTPPTRANDPAKPPAK